MTKRFLALLIISATMLAYCSSSRKTSTTSAVNYVSDIQPLVEAKCTPCHIPSKGGKKLALDTYHAMSLNINDVIRRIQLNPGEKGFMPFKHEKLSDSAINVFKNWAAAGTPEQSTR